MYKKNFVELFSVNQVHVSFNTIFFAHRSVERRTEKMKRKATSDTNGIQKKQNNQPKTSILCDLLLELLIQFPQSLIFLIYEYHPDPCVFTDKQWEKFENLVGLEWIEFKRRIEREAPWRYSASSSCKSLVGKIFSSFYFPFTSKTGNQNILLKELIDLEVQCLEWKMNIRTEFMDIIRELFSKPPNNDIRSWWPNPTDKSLIVPDFLNDRIENQTIPDLSPTEITCYYLAWRGHRCIEHVIYGYIPYLFGYYFGYKGIVWILFVFRACQEVQNGPAPVYPTNQNLGWMIEFAYYGAFPSDKIKNSLPNYLPRELFLKLANNKK